MINRTPVLLVGLIVVPVVFGQEQNANVIVLPRKGTLQMIAFSPNSDRIAVRYEAVNPNDESKIHLYDFPSLKYRGSLGKTICPQVTQFSPCGRYVVVSAEPENTGGLVVWDIQAEVPKRIKLLVQKKQNADIVYRGIEDCRFASDGKRILAFDSFPNLHVWEWQVSEKEIEEHALPGKLIGSARFLTSDTFRCFSGKPDHFITEIHRFDGNKIVKRFDGHPKFLTAAVSPDGKFAVGFRRTEDRATLVFEVDKPGTPVIDRMDDRWIPAIEAGQGGTGVKYYPMASALVLGRKLIIHYYEIVEDRVIVTRGLGFFPRDQATAKKFGLDLAKHTHLFLPVPEGTSLPVETVISPDQRWIAFTDANLPPRVWSIDSLAKILADDKTVVKK